MKIRALSPSLAPQSQPPHLAATLTTNCRLHFVDRIAIPATLT